MENLTSITPVAAEPRQHVIALRCPDQMHFDPAPLNRLFMQKDPAEAEELVCRTLEDIAMRLDMLQTNLAACRFAEMVKPAQRIAMVADQIGLTEVSISADHVTTCLRQGDGIAIEATMARLERGFDVAVSEVWNFRTFD